MKFASGSPERFADFYPTASATRHGAFIHNPSPDTPASLVRLLASHPARRKTHADSIVAGVAMSGADAAYNYDRYRVLLAEAVDEPKRLAFINLLIEEKAKDRLANHIRRSRFTGLDGTSLQGKLR
jgi:hypothetical protein